jgi:phospholipase/lecithinase/hemolysin
VTRRAVGGGAGIWSLVILMALIGFSSSLTKEQPIFEGLVVFGDSLSDMGNAGRFSDGPVWVEQLAEKLKLPLKPSELGGQNFAVGGARIEAGPQCLREQVDRFLKLPLRSGRALYVVWGGANDIFASLGQQDALSQLDAAAASLKTILSDLIRHGASDLLVPNIPNVSITPEVRAKGSDAVDEAGRLTDHFNRAVEGHLTYLASSVPGLRLYRFDVAAMAERARKDPLSFGFTDISTPCREAARCGDYVFWDEIHPTTAAHARLAEAAAAAISSQQ